MSNIGKLNITIPETVSIKEQTNYLIIKGKLGILYTKIPKEIKIEIKLNKLYIYPNLDFKQSNIYWGTYRALIANMITGVTSGFNIKLNLIGVGYKAEILDNILKLKLGFSNEIQILIPKTINVIITGVSILLSSINLQLLNEFTFKIRSYRIPDNYKGKGIQYNNENLYLKVRKK